MTLPTVVAVVAGQLAARYPDLALGNDDQRRLLTRRIAEQVAYALGPAWGTKRADPGRPPSKDAIAYLDPDTQRLYSWDWQNGTTRAVNPHRTPSGDAVEMEDITGQVFIPVSATDYLQSAGEGPGTPVEPHPAQPAPPDLEAALARLTALEERLEGLRAMQEQAFAELSTQIAGLQRALQQTAGREYDLVAWGRVIGTLRPR